jgi:hypothetical protein
VVRVNSRTYSPETLMPSIPAAPALVAVRKTRRDFLVRVPARFLKDSKISSDAKALRAVIGSFADGHTGRSFVNPSTLQKALGWGRGRREKAQRELCTKGWLLVGWQRGGRGRFTKRTYTLCEPPSTIAGFDRSGETPQLISYHSQVKSSVTKRDFAFVNSGDLT